MTQHLSCPICETQIGPDELFFQDKKRPYHRCPTCALVFVPNTYHLSQEAEKAEYDKHENTIDDEGYVRFLSRLYEPLIERIDKGACGLDFGCGPGPALAHKLEQLGHQMALYDLYYYPDEAVLGRQYDFITCTEVVEHLAQPLTQIELLLGCLKTGGTLALMTKLVINQERFANWHYKNDPTHISFFSQATFEYLAQRYSLELEFIGADVIFITKVQ